MSEYTWRKEYLSDSVTKLVVEKKTSYFSLPYLVFIICSTFYAAINIWSHYVRGTALLDPPNLKLLGLLLMVHFIYFLIVGFRLVKVSLLLARDLGLQIETKTIGKKGGKKFIPKDVIRDVIIHEYLTPYSAHYYFGIIMKDSDKLIVPFEKFELKLELLTEIYNITKKWLEKN